jgi:hypothetical protein
MVCEHRDDQQVWIGKISMNNNLYMNEPEQFAGLWMHVAQMKLDVET